MIANSDLQMDTGQRFSSITNVDYRLAAASEAVAVFIAGSRFSGSCPTSKTAIS
jgi:hypothetical protein